MPSCTCIRAVIPASSSCKTAWTNGRVLRALDPCPAYYNPRLGRTCTKRHGLVGGGCRTASFWIALWTTSAQVAARQSGFPRHGHYRARLSAAVRLRRLPEGYVALYDDDNAWEIGRPFRRSARK